MADDDEQVQILVNGEDVDGQETHEMDNIKGHHDVISGKEGIEPDTGIDNNGYDRENEGDEETLLVANDGDIKPTVDSGVEIDGGTDSDPNTDQPIPPMTNGVIDDEDGLFESGEPETETAVTSADPVDTAKTEESIAPDVVKDTEEGNDRSASPEPDVTTLQQQGQIPELDLTAEDESATAIESTAADISTDTSTAAAVPSEEEIDQAQSPEPGDDVTASQTEQVPTLDLTATAEEDYTAVVTCPKSANEETGEISVSPGVCPYIGMVTATKPDLLVADDDGLDGTPSTETDATPTSIVAPTSTSHDYAVLNFTESPWPGEGSAEPSPAVKDDHFVYVSTLDPGLDPGFTARSVDSDLNSVDTMEIPYQRLEDDAESDDGVLDTDSSIGESIDLSSVNENRPNTSTPDPQATADPDPPAPPEIADDDLNATIGEQTEWPEPPTPISFPAASSTATEADDNDSAPYVIKIPPRTPETPNKPRRSLVSLQYEPPIMAYEIEMEEIDAQSATQGDSDCRESEQPVNEVLVQETAVDGADVEAATRERVNSTDDDVFEDDDNIDSATVEQGETPGVHDMETPTEYENNGDTIKNYDEDGNENELETPEYTPPGSPEPEVNHNKYTTIDIDMTGGEDDKIRFIQHEGQDDEATRAESRAKFTRKTDWKCICLSMLCFFVLLLAAAFAFFLAMFLTGGLDRVFGQEEAPITEPPQLPQGNTVAAPPIDRITTRVQLRLNRMWDVVLDAPSSPERQELDRLFIESMDNTFRWSVSITKLVYQETIIDEFRSDMAGDGIYVQFNCQFYDVPNSILPVPDDLSTTPSADELYQQAEMYMSNVVQGTISAAIDSGLLDNIQAQQGTIEILQTEVTRG